MNSVRISDKFAVAGQSLPEAFGQLKTDGFTAVINTRPDGEESHQRGSAAERISADDAGLGYRFIPLLARKSPKRKCALQDAVVAAPAPVVAHCRSGTRSLMLYAIGEELDGRMRSEDIAAFGQTFGFDLTMATAPMSTKCSSLGRRSITGRRSLASARSAIIAPSPCRNSPY